MSVISIIILSFSLLGLLDRIFGCRFGIGKEFERGFHLFGVMALSMIGILVIAPALGVWLSPAFEGFYRVFGVDPSIIPASLFANDMGGTSLSMEINKDSAIGMYNALVVSSMMGCVISFTIPFASGVVEKRQHKDMFMGFLCGIVTIPVGCIVSGLMLNISFIDIIKDLAILILLSLVISLGLIFIPDVSVKIFKGFGTFMQIIITIGLGFGIFSFVTGKVIVSDFASFESAVMICINACITLSGAFPLMYILSRLLKKPMGLLGRKLGVNETSALCLLPTLVTNASTFGMMRDMDSRGVVLNSAFAVSAAFTFGSHLAFTMAIDGNYLVPVMVGKIISGVCSVALAAFITRGRRIEAEAVSA